MVKRVSAPSSSRMTFQRVPTGIKGLDEILKGGLPQGRPTLVCGGPGCGKTLLGMEFLVNGAMLFGDPGVFMSFEETNQELSQNFSSMHIDLQQLIARNMINIDYVHVDRTEIEETGEYDLEGLFIRLGDAIDTVGARRVVLDTIESLFTGFSNETILRSELRRLFRWLKDKRVTAVITGERGQGQLTRHGLEEYISDCVILLDHRVRDGIASRYMRVVKYRGSNHGNDEYPFLISEHGISVIPITSLGLKYEVSEKFVPTGIPRLDTMLGGKGYYQGSSVLVSGTAGSGKTSLAAHFVHASSQRGEKSLYFAFEEPASQILRNMRSIGIELQPFVDQGLLHFEAIRTSMFGIEMHLLSMQQLVKEFNPSVVVVDPITNLITIANHTEIYSMIVRLIDFLKMNHITTLFTSLTSSESAEVSTEVKISSLMDTWLLMRHLENNGERNRGMYVLKSRGMNHSNQIREFQLTDHGVELLDVYLSTEGILAGSARVAHEAKTRIEEANRDLEFKRKKNELERRQKEIDSQITALQASISAIQDEVNYTLRMEELRKQLAHGVQIEIAESRRADDTPGGDDRPVIGKARKTKNQRSDTK